MRFSNCSLPLQVRLVRYQSMYHANIKLAEMMKYTHAPTQMPYVCHTSDERCERKIKIWLVTWAVWSSKTCLHFFSCVLCTGLPSAFTSTLSPFCRMGRHKRTGKRCRWHCCGKCCVASTMWANSRNVNISHSPWQSKMQKLPPVRKNATIIRIAIIHPLMVWTPVMNNTIWRFVEKHLIEYHESR